VAKNLPEWLGVNYFMPQKIQLACHGQLDACRVTRLGEFSPIRLVFTLGCFLVRKEVRFLSMLLSTEIIVYYAILTKSGWGNIIKNSSGHPGRVCDGKKGVAVFDERVARVDSF
jgi:hypothetical protein